MRLQGNDVNAVTSATAPGREAVGTSTLSDCFQVRSTDRGEVTSKRQGQTLEIQAANVRLVDPRFDNYLAD